MRPIASFLVLSLLPAGCGGDDDGTIDEKIDMPVGGCDGRLIQVPDEEAVHEASGTTIEWSSNPPLTGHHYGSWAGWERSYTSLERGNYLHNAEHGGVVLLYNCADGCPDVVAELLDAARRAPADPTCVEPITKRVLIAPDPLLPEGVQVAAVAWNVGYTASCCDPYIRTFLRTRLRHGPEDTCADGVPFGGVKFADLP